MYIITLSSYTEILPDGSLIQIRMDLEECFPDGINACYSINCNISYKSLHLTLQNFQNNIDKTLQTLDPFNNKTEANKWLLQHKKMVSQFIIGYVIDHM